MSRTTAAVVQWVTGSPLWTHAASTTADGDGAAMRRPALLRFGSDTFMDDLAGILADRPERLKEHLASPRSFRVAPPGAAPDWQPQLGQLKLYQPFHGDFNLVAASLVCRIPGMPDHTVRVAEAERVAFVLRRVVDTSGGSETELAWADDLSAGGKAWLPLAPGLEGGIATGEELFPLFPLGYRDGAQPRRLLVGLVPVASGETFKSAGRMELFPPRSDGAGGPAGAPDADPRWDQLDTRVIGPLAAIRDPDLPPQVTMAQLEEASALLLVDLADLLQQYLPALWQALQRGSRPSQPRLGLLYDELLTPADTVNKLTWRQALLQAWEQAMAIAGEADAAATLHCNLRRSTITVRLSERGDPPGTASLQGLLRDALGPPLNGDSGDGTPAELPVPKLEPSGQALYRIRCVYRRPKCEPFPTDLVSAPSGRFAIAPVFDPDAPSRQIRIPLPVDTGIKDLRKFRKNVGFLISNQLRCQMDRVTGLKQALNGELGEESGCDLGTLCQFSLPIITICALIVLLVFLMLLNIVFFWLPIFRICVPIPLRSRR